MGHGMARPFCKLSVTIKKSRLKLYLRFTIKKEINMMKKAGISGPVVTLNKSILPAQRYNPMVQSSGIRDTM
jgi:hypothetical protein